MWTMNVRDSPPEVIVSLWSPALRTVVGQVALVPPVPPEPVAPPLPVAPPVPAAPPCPPEPVAPPVPVAPPLPPVPVAPPLPLPPFPPEPVVPPFRALASLPVPAPPAPTLPPPPPVPPLPIPVGEPQDANNSGRNQALRREVMNHLSGGWGRAWVKTEKRTSRWRSRRSSGSRDPRRARS